MKLLPNTTKDATKQEHIQIASGKSSSTSLRIGSSTSTSKIGNTTRISRIDGSTSAQKIFIAINTTRFDSASRMAKILDADIPRTKYPLRVNMGPCPPLFGKILVAVFVFKNSKNSYKIAQDSLQCYLKSMNYSFVMVNLEEDDRTNKECGSYSGFYKKHCAASLYLNDTDWLMVLDADTGVVNPNHCIEEWIDDRVNIIFYERFHNFEITAGNYLIRNSEFSRSFLRNWAVYEKSHPRVSWHNYDNGALHIHVLKTVRPGATAEIKACEKFWANSRTSKLYWGYVTCVKVSLGGATRIWPGKLRIYRRGHGFARDDWITSEYWSDAAFMMHAWKGSEITPGSPFEKMFNISECGNGYSGWHWRKELKISVEEERSKLDKFEQNQRKTFPNEARAISYLTEPEIGECYPKCDEGTKK